MKSLLKKLASICILLTAGSSFSGIARVTIDEEAFQLSEWIAVSDETLGNLRGGFETGTGLMVSFGIIRTAMINGELVNSTSFNVPDMTSIANTGIVQNGANNVVDTGVSSQLGAGTLIIQNSLNDQRIQTLTVINVGVTSLGLLKSINTQTVLKDSLLGSMGIR